MNLSASTLSTCAGLLTTFAAVGQVVHPASAPTVALNWQPAANPDALAIDVDGDAQPDLTFTDSNSYASTQGMPTIRTFYVTPAVGLELALDSMEYDSAHRYQAGQPISRAVRWATNGGYVAYTVLGNGGLGGRGFFRDGQPGYVVIRKNTAGRWRYWWFNVKASYYGSGTSTVNFYGQASQALAGAVRQAAAEVLVFPNPATTGWTLQGAARYQLLDATGRRLDSGVVTGTAFISSQALAPGMYLLELQQPNGACLYRKLIRE
ncbi:T9SS type A sorting domain-containing protein [Hymenobacter sp. DH14]|uniref:T9SS type A sorting domain-containing protein n=1 Tax=Hymenobacter cyanobacteriorum TaxID=2926463 RepID=A0A9X1VJ56_9BACT|nr:T9SS type A sorting domain-containing protein [Hymenobacter cyanobacteriorum]MCI1189615.1 T9SS type A sorting domain-containing protein [Hymenobacter cyanobacteriorum]